MIAFGGWSESGALNDTWVLTNADGSGTSTRGWTALAPAGTLPSARSQSTGIYNASRNRFTIFGGDEVFCCSLLSDV